MNACVRCQRYCPSVTYCFEDITRREPGACDVVTCKGCGTEQCHGNGGARGSCAVCHFGILPGWSGCQGTCSYKGCTEPGAFACVRGKRYVCLAHAKRAKVSGLTLAEYVVKCKSNIPGYVKGLV